MKADIRIITKPTARAEVKEIVQEFYIDMVEVDAYKGIVK